MAQKEACIQETKQWLTKKEPWHEWQREVTSSRSDPVHRYVSKWVYYTLDLLETDESRDFGTPFENLGLGRLALHPTMSLLHTSVDHGSIESLRDRRMKTTLLALLGGEKVLCNERTRRWLRTVVVKLHGYSALVVFPHNFRNFSVDPSSASGGLSQNGCNVAVRFHHSNMGCPALPQPGFPAIDHRSEFLMVLEEMEAADVITLDNRAAIIEFIEKELSNIMPEGDGAAASGKPEGCDTVAIDSASYALDKHLTACYPQLRSKATPRDGNSQFSAIAQALQRKDLDSRATAKSVRAAVVSWLRRSEAVALQGGTAADLGIASYEKYCDQMALNGVWGDNLTLFAACHCFKVQIRVISSSAGGAAEHLLTVEGRQQRVVRLCH
eukprot:m51a1_g12455 hypothetical protein (383) ;mRNA; r:181-1964